jgi:hypothetical protein
LLFYRTLLVAITVTAAALVISASANAATVTDLQATHRNGQTFIVFTENGGAGLRTRYDVYRHTSPITNVSGLTKIATLDEDSGRLLYDDNPSIDYRTGQNLTTGFIISDLGSHLAANKGLLVWTTADRGCFYYAVTNSGDTAVNVGTNSLLSCVNETPQAVPGAILLSIDSNYGGTGRLARHYFAWEDYSTWQHSEWGYYGHRFTVLMPVGMAAPYPMTLVLHSAGDVGYHEPLGVTNDNTGVMLSARDLSFTGTKDPYTGTGYGYSKWTGRLNTATGLYMTVTENRIVRYAKLVRENATGDSFDFQIDSTRIYIRGSSLGSNAMQVASHHGDLFAACEVSVGMINDDAWGAEPNNTEVAVNRGDGQTIAQYRDLAYQAAHGALIPIVHSPNQDDGALSVGAYPAAMKIFEIYHQPYAIQWKAGNHAEFTIKSDFPQWDFRRFKTNEAYPAFSNASTSNTPEVRGQWGARSTDTNGQRNGYLDWGSELHPLGEHIEDSVNRFGITLKSISVDTSADVTIRNTQQFRPNAGQRVEWRNELSGGGGNAQSGSTVADAQGLVTVRLQITAGGNRLTLSCAACTASVALTAPKNLRQVFP